MVANSTIRTGVVASCRTFGTEYTGVSCLGLYLIALARLVSQLGPKDAPYMVSRVDGIQTTRIMVIWRTVIP